ncbi:MAG: hypothetical protein A2158_07260 [Chloroflexi bacterium RBG_13_46_14]|nr:MAG: hypothetical protein A2158_07260 [Chloroflexi bacterium RBG_13_46_14]
MFSDTRLLFPHNTGLILVNFLFLFPGWFIQSAQAPGTHVNLGLLPIDIYRCRMDIRYPFTIGMSLRMADIMTELRGFAANFTLQFLPLDR